jgi:hypothetical protein
MTSDLDIIRPADPSPDGPNRFDPPGPAPETAPDPEPQRRGPRRILIIGVLVMVVGVILVTAFLPGWLTRQDAAVRPANTPVTTADGRRIQATLFYLSESGTALVETTRSVLYGETTSIQVRRLVEAQIAAAPEGLMSPIPPGTVLRAAFVTETHEAYVDLGGNFAKVHPGGSLDEALTVYAIVNAVMVNLPDITGVQILVEGQEVDSLAGHIDLRSPLTKSLTWVEGNERTTTPNDQN